jgi:mono/diheme cytochrome c family protein
MTMRFVMTVSLLAVLSSPAIAAPPDQIFSQTCIACHGANGKGVLPGMPDLTSPTGPLATKTDAELTRNIMNGFKSSGSSIAMPPKGGNPSLTESDAAALVKYLRERFGRGQS